MFWVYRIEGAAKLEGDGESTTKCAVRGYRMHTLCKRDDSVVAELPEEFDWAATHSILREEPNWVATRKALCELKEESNWMVARVILKETPNWVAMRGILCVQ